MGGKKDEIKGRIKEAAGALTGNDELRDEGKADQAVGKVEQVVEKAADAVKTVVKKSDWIIGVAPCPLSSSCQKRFPYVTSESCRSFKI